MSEKTILITGLRKYSSEDAELRALDNVLVEELDVTKSDTIKSAVEATINRFGNIDVLVNNAGYGAALYAQGS